MAVMRVGFDHQVRPRGVIQTITVQGGGTEAAVGGPIWIAYPGSRFDAPPVLDGAALNQIMFAMGFEGIDEMRVEGPMSLEALRNIRAWQEAFVEMLPDQFHLIEVTPDSVVRDPGRPEKILCAYSAGLDSTFTIARHAMQTLGPASYPPSHALMIQGLDIHPRNQSGFSALVKQTRPVLEELGVELMVARTNMLAPNPRMRRFLQPFWYSFGAQIAGVLHGPSATFGAALFAGGETYSNLLIPTASSPATDYLLSGGRLNFVHDGAGFARTDKAEFVARFPTLMKSLRVCFDPPPRNCGVCEKCIRTRLNFMALGIDHPPCFEEPFEEAMIDHLKWWTSIVLLEARSVLDFAERRGATGSWLDRLRSKIVELEATPPPDLSQHALGRGVTRPPPMQSKALAGRS